MKATRAALLALGVAGAGVSWQAARSQADMPAPPVQLTREQDHQRIMDLLHIQALRNGPDGDPNSPHAANFDESKVTAYQLPDPLVLNDGKRVKSAAAWWKQRRPQIVEDFDREVYGRVPANVPKVTWQVVHTTADVIDHMPVITKEIIGHVDNSAYRQIEVNIQLRLTTPANATGPVPVMMEFGVDPQVLAASRKRFTDEQWAAYQGPGPSGESQVLARGWGFAQLLASSVQADNGDGLTRGIIGLTNKGQPRKLDDWGALRAWAWGASRALDYLETDESVNARQVGIEGLSRYGKATLVTMAYEPRFAIAFVGSSGEGGAKLSRRTFGEQVENIAAVSEYHWMAGNFLKYAGPLTPNDLPVDAHELIALCAPRPVFISSGSQQVEGGWVDAKGMFLSGVGAGPVYRLLGKKDLGTQEFPPLETALVDGELAFRQHRYGHTTGPNWPTFMTFAGRYIKAPPLAQQADLGSFEDQSDVGSVIPAGTGAYDPAKQLYTLTSAGANTWYHVDDFHYLWKKASGDLAFTAEVNFPPAAYNHDPDPHRKGILMFRESLDSGAVYAGGSWHGSGMMALQFRRERGANSEDVELNVDAPRTVRIEKHGDTFTMYLSMKGEPLHQVGASVTLHLREPFYVGLGAVSHNVSWSDKVEFSHVTLEPLERSAAPAAVSRFSTLQTISINDQFRRAMVVRTVAGYIQSPNWAPGGKSIYVHEDGRIVRIAYLDPPAGGQPEAIDTGSLVGCSGNYGVSPDGKLIAVSCSQVKGGQHDVYVLSSSGGAAPRKVTSGKVSSYFHAWSPDSQTIAFTRGSAGKADIYTVALSGGPELRLTQDTLSDGPDFSRDGKYIYFDSLRSGLTQIWRMKPDGSDAEQITDDGNNNSSPHVSPDGKAIAFLSQPAEAGFGDHVSDARLKVMSGSDGLIRNVAEFRGDRGSFSMYGWGDETHLAFVSYQELPR